jgi:hypothetical protein
MLLDKFTEGRPNGVRFVMITERCSELSYVLFGCWIDSRLGEFG